MANILLSQDSSSTTGGGGAAAGAPAGGGADRILSFRQKAPAADEAHINSQKVLYSTGKPKTAMTFRLCSIVWWSTTKSSFSAPSIK